MVEYIVVLSDGTTQKIIAKNIAGLLTNFDEEEQTITSIFRNGLVTVTQESDNGEPDDTPEEPSEDAPDETPEDTPSDTIESE